VGPERGRVNQVVFTPDGRHVVTANGNGTIYVLRPTGLHAKGLKSASATGERTGLPDHGTQADKTADRGGGAASPANERPPAARDEKGFVPLFNGKDLSGLHVDGGWSDQWTVVNNVIVGSAPTWRTRNYLLTDKDYSDFVLRFDFQIEADGHHGGVAIRAIDGEKMPLDGNRIFDHPIIKLIGPRQSAKEVTGTTHWVKSAETYVRPVEYAYPSAGPWYTMEVEVRNDTCTATLAGRQIVMVSLDKDYSGNGDFHPGLQRKKGKVGFQINTGTLRFRNIQIKELLTK
jgi:Domain of Unknown Function (DUF1080)